MRKILLVFGTRPEAIKMFPLLKELQKYKKEFNVMVCVTAQHREMLDQVLNFFEIIPDFDLNTMTNNQSLSLLTANIITSMNSLLDKLNPDIVLVHGDTTTTFSASVASFYRRIPVGHVEAGLRTYNMSAPFPEEFNRKVVSQVTKWHFAPTKLSKRNLLKENIPSENIWVTGNTVVDSLRYILKNFKDKKDYSKAIKNKFRHLLGFDVEEKQFILVTGHRRENFGQGFKDICNSLKELSTKYRDISFVYPIHLNPLVIKPVNRLLGKVDNIKIIKPLPYQEFIFLLSQAYMVLTDSGGLQEEASSLGVPVLVMRKVTERPEALESGIIKMVGTNPKIIVDNVTELIENKIVYTKTAFPNIIYGDGLASNRIVKVLRTLNE